MASDTSAQKRIVIVGGGAAGAQIARNLSQQLTPASASITLIEAREYFLHLPGALRMIASAAGDLEDKVLVPYDKLFLKDNGKVVRSSVTSILHNEKSSGGRVITDSGVEYPYDVLVLASGNTWEGPLALPPTREEAVSYIRTWREKIKNAQSIAIVGGGAVGSELAGEIRDIYADKKITVIQKSDHLLQPVYPQKFRTDVDKRWTQRQIRLILNDEINEISESPSSPISTRGGQSVEADLVIPTRGGRPNTAFVASLGQGILTEGGLVKVEPTLQVKGIPGVFAAGDIVDWNEVKQAVKCEGHGKVVIANVKDVVEGKPPKTVYKPIFEIIVLTNGAGGGAAYMDVLWGLHFGNRFTKMLKAKDLFITKTRQSMGY